MSSRIVDSQPPEAAWSDVERELLGAAREDRMPAELEARLRDALAFAPGSAPVPTSASVETAPRASFSDTARARSLFAGKLPLWGMLGVVALAVVGYAVLSRYASQPMAAASRQQVAPRMRSSATDQVRAHESVASQRDARPPAAPSAPRESTDVTFANAQVGASSEAASAQPGGAGLRSANALAGARRDASSAHEDGAGREASRGQRASMADARRDGSARAVARPHDGARPEAASLRPRAATGADSQAVPPPAAETAAAQTPRSGVSPAHEANSASAHAAHSGEADQLRLEAQLLQLARSALGHGALSEARQWLARYQAQFARGALQPESQVLEIELAVRSGARTAAKTQAQQFLAQHPNHPLRDRVQLLTEEQR